MWLFFEGESIDFDQCIMFKMDMNHCDIDFYIEYDNVALSFRFETEKELEAIYNFIQELVIAGKENQEPGYDLKKSFKRIEYIVN